MSRIHHRTKVRRNVVNLLKNRTVCMDRVYGGRFRNVFADAELPLILVYTGEEPINVYNESPREYERNLLLRIEIMAKANDDLDDVLESIAADVEYWMHQDHAKYDSALDEDLVRDTVLVSLEPIISNEGDTLIGSLILTYQMPWYGFAVADDSTLKNFDRIDMKINMEGEPSGQIDSEDLIEISGGL